MDIIPTLEAKAKELENAAATIRETIRILSELNGNVPITESVRVHKTPIKSISTGAITHADRFVSLFTTAGRFLHSTEIGELLPDVNHLSSALHTAKTKKNKIISTVIGNSKNNTVWGLPDWLNPDGTIVHGKEPIMDHLRFK